MEKRGQARRHPHPGPTVAGDRQARAPGSWAVCARVHGSRSPAWRFAGGSALGQSSGPENETCSQRTGPGTPEGPQWRRVSPQPGWTHGEQVRGPEDRPRPTRTHAARDGLHRGSGPMSPVLPQRVARASSVHEGPPDTRPYSPAGYGPHVIYTCPAAAPGPHSAHTETQPGHRHPQRGWVAPRW